MRTIKLPTFDIEHSLPFHLIAGVDEAGRGPLCGPVVAGAVMFTNPLVGRLCPKVTLSATLEQGRPTIIPPINDSKKMTAAARERAYDYLTTSSDIVWAIGMCSPAEIDTLNILWASMLAMSRAIDALTIRPEFVLVDGNRLPNGVTPARAVVHGDALSMSIAAASIIAKVTRDRIMTKLAGEYPQYGWDKNMGYPTAAHIAAIQEFGINEHYRKTFGPVKELL